MKVKTKEDHAMITCPKCNKKLSDDAKFCNDCGEQILKTIICPNCGKPTSTEVLFCQNCGVYVGEKSVEERPKLNSKKRKANKLPKKAVVFGMIGVAAVAVIVLVAFLFSGGSKKSKNNYALYLKDEELFFTDFKKNSEEWQLTSRLIDTDDISESYLANEKKQFSLFTDMSEDGKYIFFPDKMEDDYGFNLYYKEVNKLGSEAIKVDSDITFYTVNTAATLITYIKGDEDNLYQYKIKDDTKEKIASDVAEFNVSDDGKKIVYRNYEDSIYRKNANKEKEKVASNVSSFTYLTEDFSTVYYVKDDSLYKQVEGKEKEKIAADVYSVLWTYDSGEIYYLKGESMTGSLLDYVTDDMKEEDDSISEPIYPDYPGSPHRPNWWDFDTNEEYQIAYDAYEAAYEEWKTECEQMKKSYEEACFAYSEKTSRDELRNRLKEESINRQKLSLCFHNGVEEAVITDNFKYYGYAVAAETPVLSYEAYSQSEIGKIKLSEIESVYDVETMVEKALTTSCERYIAVKGVATLIEQEKEAVNFKINPSGTLVYYVDNIPDNESYGELYRITISNGVVGKPEVYDSDVYMGLCDFVSGSALEYFKDYKEGAGEYYINKNRIDYDVRFYNVHYDDGKVFYISDFNSEKSYGTLKFYDGEKSVKIADDVHDFSVAPDGRVLYLYDYSMKYYKGELHEWYNKKTRKIDDDVISIFSIYDDKYRGYIFEW